MLQLQPLLIPSKEVLHAYCKTQICGTHSGGKVQHFEHSACREGTQCCSSHRASASRKLQRRPEGICCTGSDATGGTSPDSVWHQIRSSVPSPQPGGFAYAQEVRPCRHYLCKNLALQRYILQELAVLEWPLCSIWASSPAACSNKLDVLTPSKQACISSVGACCVSQRLVVPSFCGFLGKSSFGFVSDLTPAQNG